MYVHSYYPWLSSGVYCEMSRIDCPNFLGNRLQNFIRNGRLAILKETLTGKSDCRLLTRPDGSSAMNRPPGALEMILRHLSRPIRNKCQGSPNLALKITRHPQNNRISRCIGILDGETLQEGRTGKLAVIQGQGRSNTSGNGGWCEWRQRTGTVFRFWTGFRF